MTVFVLTINEGKYSEFIAAVLGVFSTFELVKSEVEKLHSEHRRYLAAFKNSDIANLESELSFSDFDKNSEIWITSNQAESRYYIISKFELIGE